MEKKALGRGLRSLIPDATPPGGSGEEVVYIHIDQIKPNRYQPREHLDNAAIEELAESIKRHGLLQPITVRQTGEGFELIIGERRYRACRRAGMKRVPAIVRGAEDRNALELALLENVQREDLNPVEEAKAYKRLVDDFGLTQESISDTVGKQRSTIANALRLLRLPDTILETLRQGRITLGHAKLLLSIDDATDQARLFDEITREALSVRDVERSGALQRPTRKRRRTKRQTAGDPHVRDVEDRLQRALGTKVRIIPGRRGGRVVIEYYTSTDLDRLIAALLPRAEL